MYEHAVLIVDDEINVLEALKRVLRKEPYTLITASNGSEGLEILQKTPVDLVLSDQQMPGMSGVEFLIRVRQQFPDIIRVVFSGYTDIETITASINEGNVYKFIHKPWEDAELKEIIREALKVHKLQIENERLSKEIKIKNEELLRFNKDLELEVQRRTEKIIKQSRELEMSRDILESLPVAVICLNRDKTVMYTNSLAGILFARFDDGLVGSNLEGKFDQDLIDIVNATVDTTLPQRSIVSIEDNYYYGLKCVPICSGEEVNMIILSFSELD